MKKIALSFAGIAALLALSSFQNDTMLCDARELETKASNLLDPYKYDSSELTKILYKDQESVSEIEVPLFIGEKYRFIFELEALPKHVEVQIYNKSKDVKNRKLLFSSKSMGDKTEFQCEISLTRTAYVDYIIPPAKEGVASGCAVFMVGYKLK